MERITIGRLEGHPSRAVGCIEPESKRWQLVLDEDGYPHLYLRVQLGDAKQGMVCIDDLLRGDLSVKGIMNDPDFGTDIEVSDLEDARDEVNARRAEVPIPCPVQR